MTATEHPRIQALKGVVSENDRYYFGYQYGLGAEHLVPYFKSKGVQFAGKNICEIGCGEGGVLAAMADDAPYPTQTPGGPRKILGIDIRQEAIDRAEIIFDALGINSEFHIHDVTNQETPPEWREQFDFVTLRDVMEHLHETERSLQHVMDFLRPGGYLYVVFPPYYSPFGGHQHLLRTVWGKLPYVQALPDVLFQPVAKSGQLEIDIEEVTRLRDIRLTIGKFRSAARQAGLELVDEQLYLLRPVFKLKFGLPAIKMNVLRHVPLLREIAVLEAGYLLRKPDR
ncbi:MAG: class I SAM-dependent methyltransferase [Bacteroidota bacterium]|nr:class I SAM-dependent methyltransferase [Bacteroidota bacterium]MDP4234076.1 class I SAM-dependent methyltransferase [Bacteroidota bacterium]MDP4243017.1 class I SAM-dependent methyltransferase [Bacteroidota bacterium]MDP4287443.1 class I SAM-dependent methyltransferase [Bacteroidota bacterium]